MLDVHVYYVYVYGKESSAGEESGEYQTQNTKYKM